MADQKKRSGDRHRGRLRAVEVLFEAEARGLNVADVALQREELHASDPDVRGVPFYAGHILRGIAAEQDRIDETIIAYLQDWTLARLPAVDRAILRLAVWELLCGEDVPPVVAVDEAVELAKELSTDESPGFINGVLGQIVLIAPQVRAAAAAQRATD